MAYAYGGKAIGELLESYASDETPFVTGTKLKFPKREFGMEEEKLLNEIFFPNCWNQGAITKDAKKLSKKLNELGRVLHAGLMPHMKDRNQIVVDKAIDSLPKIRALLKKDVEAAYKGDPAARTYAEIVRSYPSLRVMIMHRFAHELYSFNVPSYPRELAEHAHSKTGIDIHPGAKIGQYFFIDHGTGVVIGETSEIGEWARLYQGVTLGVLHFEKEGQSGVLKKGYKRHPALGDHVVVGAGAKILGPVIVGSKVNVGANSWVEQDVPGNATVFITEHPKLIIKKRK